VAWFNKNNTSHGNTEAPHDESVEIVVAKEANKEVVALAKQANKIVHKLLKENHFTIKIFMAAGGKTKKRVGSSGH